MTVNKSKPELLAPAGDWECMKAAWENGADAVYFGIDSGFNARARAKNFQIDEASRAIAELHRRGLAAYVTLNTLVFTEELPEIERLIRELARANVDAILVQDLGVARLASAVCPDLPIHASTQMTLTSAQCIAAASELGIDRVVLPRESSLDDIRRIAAETSVPLEVFVHGALCVAYSGQCLTSESLGGRSANRGQCAQACRMPYELVCDGRDVELGDQKYLLSPQDLAAYSLIPELIAAGVCSFKIEGRLKTPEYVANITRHYRTAIDRAWENRPIEFMPRDVYEMEMSFSRGFSPGWIEGCDHKRLVPGKSSAKRGVLLGEIQSIGRSGVTIELRCPIARGDGVVFAGDRFRGQEQGGRVYQVFRDGVDREDEVAAGPVELRFDRAAIDLAKLSVGQAIWKTDDPRLNRRLRTSFEANQPLRRVDVDFEVTAHVGRPLSIVARSTAGAVAESRSEQPLDSARKHVLTATLLHEQLGRLGETFYRIREVRADIEGDPMVPLSVIGQLRRNLIAQLDAWRRPARVFAEESVLSKLCRSMGNEKRPSSGQPPAPLGSQGENERASRADWPQTDSDETELGSLAVLVRDLQQLDACFAANVQDVYVDLHDIREFKSAAARARAAKARIWLATPRIQKPAEMGVFRAMQKHGADGMLVRNLAGLIHFVSAGIPVVADFSLNVANELTAQYVMARGAWRLTPSYDLNRDQLLDLVAAVPPSWLEVVVHQHMPMFHMEHCVFCAVLSPGTDKTNCGRPCDRHVVHLRDQLGFEHRLTADVGCRNTLFNATCQSGAEIVPTLLERGVRRFRLEFLEETPQQIAATIGLYRRLLAGKVNGRQVWSELKATNQVGVTRGTLEAKRNPLAIV
jgi:putative protease